MVRGQLLPRSGLKWFQNVLDAYALRNRVTSENIANAQTPGYGAKSVSFEETLKRAASTIPLASVPQPAGGIPIESVPQRTRGATIRPAGGGYWNGVNDVNMETEMVTLATTTLSYNMVTKLVKGRVETLRAAISGRTR